MVDSLLVKWRRSTELVYEKFVEGSGHGCVGYAMLHLFFAATELIQTLPH